MEKNRKYMEQASCSWSEDSLRLFVNASQTARTLFFYVQELGYFRTFLPYYTKRQNLNSFLIIYTLSGCGSLEYEGDTYSLPPETGVFVNCRLYHHYKTISKEPWEFLWIHFNGAHALGYYEEFAKNGFHLYQAKDPVFMEETMRHILTLYQKQDAATELIASNSLSTLLTEFLLDTCTASAPAFFMPDAVKQVKIYIEKHFREPITLAFLEKLCGMSKYHLSRKFKQFVGMPVNEYIISMRISHAKDLLRYSALSVNEIVYEAGMNNTSYFIRAFKAREGMTPSAFRRQWQEPGLTRQEPGTS